MFSELQLDAVLFLFSFLMKFDLVIFVDFVVLKFKFCMVSLKQDSH